MKKIILSILCLAGLSAYGQAPVWVQPHINQRTGTVVEGHYRSAPNHTRTDNYNQYPNINPATGQQGTRVDAQQKMDRQIDAMIQAATMSQPLPAVQSYQNYTPVQVPVTVQQPVFTGPRGGVYTISPTTGRKVYQ